MSTITTNVRGTEILLELCNKLFIASTSEIYGKGGERLDEDHDRVMGSVRNWRWAYACTKEMDEFLAIAYHAEHKLPVIIGRLFNIVGPRQTGQYGMVLPTFVGQALRGEPITVYGDGQQRRCFCHVLDTVDAIARLMMERRQPVIAKIDRAVGWRPTRALDEIIDETIAYHRGTGASA